MISYLRFDFYLRASSPLSHKNHICCAVDIEDTEGSKLVKEADPDLRPDIKAYSFQMAIQADTYRLWLN